METLITLLLVGLVLGLILTLFTRGMRSYQATTARDEAAQSANLALDRLLSEMREATSLVSTSPNLEFVKVDPAATNRIVSPPPLSWDPEDPAFHLSVRYRLDAARGELLREVGPQGSFQESSLLASQVSGLACVQRSPGIFVVTLSLRSQDLIKTYCGSVVCPLLR